MGNSEKLSPLESNVISILWSSAQERNSAQGSGGCKVRDLHKSLKARRQKVALTSVAVILDRLHDKGLVTRTAETGRGGIHYIYSAAKTREEFEKGAVATAVEGLMERFGPVAVNYFNERFGKEKRFE